MRAFLAKRGKPQAWLAREMEYSGALISGVVNGYRALTPPFIRKFRRVTGIDLTPFPRDKRGYLTGAAPPRAKPVIAPPPPEPAPDQSLPSAYPPGDAHATR
jgi:hypothetical protein